MAIFTDILNLDELNVLIDEVGESSFFEVTDLDNTIGYGKHYFKIAPRRPYNIDWLSLDKVKSSMDLDSSFIDVIRNIPELSIKEKQFINTNFMRNRRDIGQSPNNIVNTMNIGYFSGVFKLELKILRFSSLRDKFSSSL